MIRIELKSDGLRETLARLEGRLSNFAMPLEEVGLYMVSSTIRKIKSNIPPPNSPLTQKVKGGNLTLRDTGRLMSSITYRKGPDYVAIGTNVKYARIQQLGGTITPKRAKKLAIPASAETRNIMRKHGASVRAALGGLKSSGWRIWFREKSIMGVKSKGKPEVLFVRKKSVKIPARPFLKVDDADRRVIVNIFRRYLEVR